MELGRLLVGDGPGDLGRAVDEAEQAVLVAAPVAREPKAMVDSPREVAYSRCRHRRRSQ